MSLDLHIEADRVLTIPMLSTALAKAGATEVENVNGALEAAFASGLRLTADDETTDFTIYAEDKKGLEFKVGMRCSIRIKGPEPEGQSSMDELEKIAESIAQTCSSLFLLTFQYESTLYWRDAMGLHRSRAYGRREI
ncbi:hypothetical protein CD58_00445 [Pseudomonas brassicacearum]|uniref:hypothetical protein n=1 Tax=Pseudomonas brassicacearum TaxID=930166 RepID=UPI00042EFC05|nr:hypothetical protein [Pseudomonas brassicacearum]AHL31462.1 hypothetical protein CD58_00445 [Pseudomonas brassicacearum]